MIIKTINSILDPIKWRQLLNQHYYQVDVSTWGHLNDLGFRFRVTDIDSSNGYSLHIAESLWLSMSGRNIVYNLHQNIFVKTHYGQTTVHPYEIYLQLNPDQPKIMILSSRDTFSKQLEQQIFNRYYQQIRSHTRKK